MRCHRIGQTEPVTVRFFGLANSIDEKITKILEKKTTELTEIFDFDKDEFQAMQRSFLACKKIPKNKKPTFNRSGFLGLHLGLQKLLKIPQVFYEVVVRIS